MRGWNGPRLTLVLLAGDVPLNRVKFNARHDYEYIANFKILQNIFKAKKIDKVRRAASCVCVCLCVALGRFAKLFMLEL